MVEQVCDRKGLMVDRYENGKIAEVCEYVYSQSIQNTPDGMKSTNHLVGAYLAFYKSGKLKTISIAGKPTFEPSTGEITSGWRRTFNAKGEMIGSFGKQNELNLPKKMTALLKSEGLLPVIQQALSKASVAKKTRIALPKQGRC